MGADGNLAFPYQRLNAQGEFVTDRCRSIPKVLENDRYRLHEYWR